MQNGLSVPVYKLLAEILLEHDIHRLVITIIMMVVYAYMLPYASIVTAHG